MDMLDAEMRTYVNITGPTRPIPMDIDALDIVILYVYCPKSFRLYNNVRLGVDRQSS